MRQCLTVAWLHVARGGVRARAERWLPGLGAGGLRWSALVLGAVVLATGCATVPMPSGAGDTYSHRTGKVGEIPEDRTVPLQEPAPEGVRERRPRVRLRRRHGPSVVGTDVRVVSPEEMALREAGPEARASREPAATGAPVPEGWPDWEGSEEELLAPFFACASPAEFIALQRTVDMARVVERLGNWSAVRLGALGPLVDGRASQVLTRKRAAFLLTATADHGPYAEVFALFIVHTAFDDELHPLLLLLARDKQLGQTLGPMEAVRAELERRGLKLSDYPERGEQGGDVLRGLASAARDALNSSQASDGGRFEAMWRKSRQLPPAYQQALHELGDALALGHFGPERWALGGADQMTFGVPLGFYHLVGGTAEGVKALRQGQYEQATRQLAPAALVVGLYAGGKVAGAGRAGAEARLEGLKGVAQRLGEQLGLGGLEEVARHIRTSREAALMVAVEGELGALALHEARGKVAEARAVLSEAKEKGAGPGGPRASGGEGLGGLAALVDEAAGHTLEVVQAKLRQVELEAAGPRLPAEVGLLKKLNATLDSPPPGVPEGYALWNEYVSYRHKRLAELEKGQGAEGPLRWEGYERMRGMFARGLAFERAIVAVLRADAALPQAQRVWLRGFIQPRIEVHVGVSKPGTAGIRYADVLVIEERPPAGQPPRVETFSFKSRNLAPLKRDPLQEQMRKDARAALDYYGGTLDILRRSIRLRVQVQRVRLVYEGGALMPKLPDLEVAMDAVKGDVKGVEILFQ